MESKHRIEVPVASFSSSARPDQGASIAVWLEYYQKAYPYIYSIRTFTKPEELVQNFYRYFEEEYSRAQLGTVGTNSPLDLIWDGKVPIEFFEYDKLFSHVFQIFPELYIQESEVTISTLSDEYRRLLERSGRSKGLYEEDRMVVELKVTFEVARFIAETLPRGTLQEQGRLLQQASLALMQNNKLNLKNPVNNVLARIAEDIAKTKIQRIAAILRDKDEIEDRLHPV